MGACAWHAVPMLMVCDQVRSALYCDDEGSMLGDTLLYTYSSTWIACVPAFADLGANRN